jgi:hypothetical protein
MPQLVAEAVTTTQLAPHMAQTGLSALPTKPELSSAAQHAQHGCDMP